MKRILIAGGGFSGLYSAIKLSEVGFQVTLLEASPDRWGGRMETEVLEDFVAEWGPMRFETKLQPKFGSFIESLGVELAPFVGPTANPSLYPQYDLQLQEQNLDTLGLLRRGLLLIMGKKPNDPMDWGGQSWIDGLTEKDYQEMRENATLNGMPLWNMGFWNALSEDGILSHQAVMKIRDTGTFYHMIPDNLNAIEWIIWWLRALKTEGQILATVKKGTHEITVQMLKRLEANSNAILKLNSKLISFKELEGNQVEVTYSEGMQVHSTAYDHVILALPQYPLKMLASSLPEKIASQLDSVNGFSMLKVFFVVENPWWGYTQPPQARANRMPTREIHYFRRPEEEDVDKKGMLLLYTDRPATEFWTYFIKDRANHDRAEVNMNDAIKSQFANFMARDVSRSLETNEATTQTGLQLTKEALIQYNDMSLSEIKKSIEDSIVTYGIRDWSCAPYGAGNHCWRPGVKSWEVQELFKAFSLGSGNKNVHIVGEAYSNYTGFIEGAINSADLALEEIDNCFVKL
jgi:monoamine oxidase